MAISKADKLKRIHDEAVLEFDSIQSALREERLQCLQDRRFCSIAGAQWEGELEEQFANKPKFEVNKVHLAVIRIINEYRNNRVTVDFVSKEGAEYDELADTCDGLYRADEQDSCAEEAYDNAFEEGVTGGFGAWRLRTKYEDEEDDEDDRQRIVIEPIFDADTSVFFDLNAKRQDKSDAKRCYVLTAMTPEAYTEEWGDDPASWPKEIYQSEFDWYAPDVVYVAEYYRVEEVSETIHIFTGLVGDEERYSDSELADDEELEPTLLATGFKKTGEKKVRRRKVHKYILSGGKVLDDCGYIAGKHIPVIPFYGKRWFVDNVERCMGHVRLAKDAQRLKNMQLSKLGEISSLSTVEKPIFTPEQMSGHGMMWAEDNIKNYPYMLANPVTDANGTPVAMGPIGYTKPPQIPPAMAALLQITEQDMSDLLGNQQAGEEMQPNMSGKAVELIQNRLDMQSFIYMSNFAKAIRRCGEVWLGMARDVYVESGRKMKTMSAQGEVSGVEIMRPIMSEGAEVEYENDLSEASFDVVADVGPTSSSKRAATVRSLTGMMTMTQDPETLNILSSMAMMNMEGEGISEVRQFFRKRLVRMGAIKPTDEEAAEMQQEAANTPPDANTQYLNAAATEAEAKAAKARADTVLTVAKAEETRAKTAETIAGIDRDDRSELMNVVDRMQQPVQPTQGM